MKRHDPKGYYALLKMNPDASPGEIRLAYGMLEQTYKGWGKPLGRQYREAYAALSDPEQRRLYDREPPQRFAALSRFFRNSPLNSVPLLIVLLLALLWIVGFANLKAHLINFETGDDLYWTSTNKPLGVVLEYDPQHRFPDTIRAPAYRIQPGSGAEPAWYAAPDVNRNCAPR